MKKNIKIKPSKSQSILGLIVGCVFIFIGLFIIVPSGGIFGIFWTILALVITVTHGINAFSDNGIATEVIEVSSDEEFKGNRINKKDVEEYNFDEKLRKLKALRDEGVLSEIEYQMKKREILEEKW